MPCAVVDIGKTHSRLSVIDESGTHLFQHRTANRVLQTKPYPHFDVEKTFAWLCQALREALATCPVERLICTTHGAAGALVAGDKLVLPVMDYEWAGPSGMDMAYESRRDPFAATLSPSLPAGLNLARQLFWQSSLWPAEYAAADGLLLYPQYWAWRLCGERAAELSSLGSHTDLWQPLVAAPSALAVRLGADRRLPPLRHAWSVVGRLDLQRVSLERSAAAIDVHCGVHDSSAAYVAQFPDPAVPGTVVSTGTWIVCMAPFVDATRLDAARDVSGTVSVFGRPLACSRFMGGREFAALAGAEGLGAMPGASDLTDLMAAGSFALPSHAASGPLQHAAHAGILSGPPPPSAPARAALAALYCALVTDVCLDLISASGPIVVDGPFAANPMYLQVLATLRAGELVSASVGTEGPTHGAAGLVLGAAYRPAGKQMPMAPLSPDAVLGYRERWRKLVEARGE